MLIFFLKILIKEHIKINCFITSLFIQKKVALCSIQEAWEILNEYIRKNTSISKLRFWLRPYQIIFIKNYFALNEQS